MKRVLLIQNDPPESLGYYETLLREKAELTVIHAYRMGEDEAFPPASMYDSFIIGPTPISANDAEKHSFLRKELDFLREVIQSGKPCLGVCCGAQMLAKLQGGQVLKSPSKEVGVYSTYLTEEGAADPLFAGFPEEFKVFHWHSEMFTVPPGGDMLARGDPCPVQAYRKGNIRGIIFHLELDSCDAEKWANAYPDEPRFIGKTSEQVVAECRLAEKELRRLATLFIENYISLQKSS